jgi:hypothetical protein
VDPGRSACLRCVDLAKAERDPAWPLVLAQSANTRSGHGQQACDVVLAAATAALAASQALEFLDRAPDGTIPTVNGTLELVLPDWQWHRRTWRPHHACICAAADSGSHVSLSQ